MSEPYVLVLVIGEYISKHVVIDIMTDSGIIRQCPLGDMGIVPYANCWNPVNFTIDAKKVHLLPTQWAPEAPIRRPDDDPFDIWYDDFDSQW